MHKKSASMTALIIFLTFISLSFSSCIKQKTAKRNPNVEPNAVLTLALRNGTYSNVIRQCLPAFEAEYNVVCNVLELSEDSLHSQVASDARNEIGAYDLCMVDGSWMAEYTSNNVLTNLTSLGYELDDDIIPATTAICYYKGGLYLTPFYGNVTVLLYNKLLVSEAGYSEDKIRSLEDIQNICNYAQGHNTNGFVYRGDTENNIVVDFLPILLSYGGWVVDVHNRPSVNTKAFKEALYAYKELIKTGTAMEKEDLIDAVATKKAAMAVGWPGWYSPTRNSPADYCAISGKVKDTSIAYNANIYGIWTLGIPRNSKNKDYAIKLLDYLMNPGIQRSTVPKGGVPCRYSSLQNPEVLRRFPQYGDVCRALEGGVYRPVMENWSTFYTILGKEIRAILNESKSVEEGLAAAQKELEKALAVK